MNRWISLFLVMFASVAFAADVNFKFKDVDLSFFIRSVSEVLDRDYVISPDVAKGSVSRPVVLLAMPSLSRTTPLMRCLRPWMVIPDFIILRNLGCRWCPVKRRP